MKEKSPILTNEQKEMIRRYLFGPFKREWYDKKGILDNRDTTIAEDLNLSLYSVRAYTSKITNKHFNNIGNESKQQPNGKKP